MATEILPSKPETFRFIQSSNRNSDLKSRILASKQIQKKLEEILIKFTTPRQLLSLEALKTIGFTYIGDSNTVICHRCNLEVTLDSEISSLYKIHKDRRPTCPFILETKRHSFIQNLPTISSTTRTTATFNQVENPSKRQKTEDASTESAFLTLVETSNLEQARRRTFSNWTPRNLPTSAQMIEAGFFNCNVGDRVICLYCNLICQQWTPHTDDPCEVHKVLRPNCIFVRANLIRPAASSIIIVNESATGLCVHDGQTSNSLLTETLKSTEIVYTTPANPNFIELPKRNATFGNWPKDNLPSVEDLTRAGFFYTGTRSIVTCFYCNGSLQNWGATDNPMIEHARWFPNCAYAKQLCGDELYRKVQESKRAQQERLRMNEMKEKGNLDGTLNAKSSTNNRQLIIQDESTLSRLVAARLDLPVSQRLLSLDFKLSIIKRCWEDQLRLKRDDFISDSDLFIACLILKRQIEHIDGKKENIVIPSIRMKQIRERTSGGASEEVSSASASQSATGAKPNPVGSSTPNTSEIPPTPTALSTMEVSEKSNEKPETKSSKSQPNSNGAKKDSNEPNTTNQCVLCWNEEKRLACIPCGHLATCVPCGHSLRSCPICRREIEAFVRVYI